MDSAHKTALPNKNGLHGMARICAAAGYSKAGLKHAWQGEAAFREEVLLLAPLLPAAFWLGQTATERALLLVSCLAVLVVELLNSAIEAVVDLASPERHVLAGRAKDMGSAAVFIALIQVIVVWGLLIYQRFS